jgi:hypothetical protein
MNDDDLAELRRLADALPAVLEDARAGRITPAEVAELVATLGDLRARLLVERNGPAALLRQLPVPDGRA